MDPLLIYAYAAVTLFAVGIYAVAPNSCGGFTQFLATTLGAVLWPLTLPVWFGTATRSCVEKYIARR